MGQLHPEMRDFDGSWLASIRKAMGVSISQLASLTGIDQRELDKYQSGSKKPTIRNAARIADALDIKVDDLLSDRGEVS